MTKILFDKIVDITEEYLGPAAPRFVARQVSFHLDKSPSELSTEDIPKLVEWTKVTLALLTEDKALVQEYARKVSDLAEEDH
jgi:hypothetical protein